MEREIGGKREVEGVKLGRIASMDKLKGSSNLNKYEYIDVILYKVYIMG